MSRTAVVTGGSAGIGLACAERLVRDGWQVAILARDAERLEQARAILAVHGPKVLAITVDVADAQGVEAAAERVERELGSIDAWVNNAMATVVARADVISADEYRRVTEVTYLGQVHGTLAALRRMKPRRRGVIVQVSSGLGFRAVPMQAAYCAAKLAVSGFTDALRAELMADDLPIALSVIYLPAVNTPQPSWARNRSGYAQVLPDPLYDPRLCAQAIVQAIADPQREIWVGRSTVKMALGQALAPGFSDRQASGFIQAQQGEPSGDKPGNLDAPVTGPARIDGNARDRVVGSELEIFTARQRDALKLAIAGTLVACGAVAGAGLRRLLPDIRR